MATSHESNVNRIAANVRRFFTRGEPFRVFHGSTNSTRPAHGAKVVDISTLNNILEISETSKTAVVEPNVPMDKLVQATLARGMVPPVVMESPGITLGGGFSGSAGDSSPFRYGFFDQTVQAVELVLGSGDVVRASAIKHPDLFRGAAGTAGTLGIVTKLELSLIPARRFTSSNLQRRMGPVVLSSRQEKSRLPARASRSPSRRRRPTDYIPLAEYLFRYDRSGYWVGAQAFAHFPLIPFNRFTRWFLNDFMHTRMLYRALQGSNMSFGQMLCPLKAIERPSFHPSYCSLSRDGPPEPMLNIGLWGAASEDVGTFIHQNRELESRGGILGAVRPALVPPSAAEVSLPNLYDKVHVDVGKVMGEQGKKKRAGALAGFWSIAGFMGIRAAIRSKD
ncbi:hypothetical protein CHGG_09522 [Chaetomium globosum CBS 148.51]|uniref:Delta(24)-sterol reductase n=1 Tax=Chaetomium globosum (strain ATCC 6205 / CBS 148.51 / DSM 1962 / NBRC 6347 / NRRL 1970) TaxID=306901 RepID=Q2GR82_CHAGB|nr:uncharacterized protein CHGG_09522 [Chaetomium globosum CBS 148.51]EAQ85508.1 hypothetical protein CHGG_09522 [Chaetomium globosum CBS 148.51]